MIIEIRGSLLERLRRNPMHLGSHIHWTYYGEEAYIWEGGMARVWIRLMKELSKFALDYLKKLSKLS